MKAPEGYSEVKVSELNDADHVGKYIVANVMGTRVHLPLTGVTQHLMEVEEDVKILHSVHLFCGQVEFDAEAFDAVWVSDEQLSDDVDPTPLTAGYFVTEVKTPLQLTALDLGEKVYFNDDTQIPVAGDFTGIIQVGVQEDGKRVFRLFIGGVSQNVYETDQIFMLQEEDETSDMHIGGEVPESVSFVEEDTAEAAEAPEFGAGSQGEWVSLDGLEGGLTPESFQEVDLRNLNNNEHIGKYVYYVDTEDDTCLVSPILGVGIEAGESETASLVYEVELPDRILTFGGGKVWVSEESVFDGLSVKQMAVPLVKGLVVSSALRAEILLEEAFKGTELLFVFRNPEGTFVLRGEFKGYVEDAEEPSILVGDGVVAVKGLQYVRMLKMG